MIHLYIIAFYPIIWKEYYTKETLIIMILKALRLLKREQKVDLIKSYCLARAQNLPIIPPILEQWPQFEILSALRNWKMTFQFLVRPSRIKIYKNN